MIESSIFVKRIEWINLSTYVDSQFYGKIPFNYFEYVAINKICLTTVKINIIYALETSIFIVKNKNSYNKHKGIKIL